MKKALIFANIILAVVTLWVFFQNLVAYKGEKQGLVKPVKLQPLPKNNRKTTEENPLPDLDTAVKKISQLDVFNPIRSPLANVRNSRTQLTLVGTFHAGNIRGAIIRQSASQRQFNPYLAQMMSAGGMGGGMGGGRGGRGGMGGGRFTNWSQVAGRNSGMEKQYVRIGDTLSNGYILAEVTRSSATLLRGNDRIELELQDPSRNRASRNSSGRRQGLNASQQFQQAQIIMQGQMMRTMQQMQRSIQSGGGGGNRGGRRR